MSEFTSEFDATQPLSVQDWFLIGRDRELPDLLTMPEGLLLNLGEGKRPIGDAMPLDREHGWDAEKMRIPWCDGVISGIWAHAFFDYISQDELLSVLAECQRVLQVGGVMNIVGPHGNSDLWNEDALRKTRFTEETWRNLFDSPWYDPQADCSPVRRLRVHTTFIMGVKWRNLSLFTQLVKD